MVRVVVDRDGGVDLDAVAAVSGPIAAAVEAADLFGETPYVLEVSSPGVDRPLRTPTHWRRATGRLVTVTLRGGGSITGRVEGADDHGVDLDLGRHGRRLRYDEVERARGPGRVRSRPGRRLGGAGLTWTSTSPR